jgi:hypothetical protein
LIQKMLPKNKRKFIWIYKKFKFCVFIIKKLCQ